MRKIKTSLILGLAVIFFGLTIKVFGIPGIGNLFTNSILNRDYTLIMGITVFFSVILVICILVVDILYVLIDPRIKYQ